jgi:dTDP-glucose 4,6-dehydratase
MSYTPKKMLVTGGAGFIGSNFVRHVLATEADIHIVNLDLLTYAGNLANLENLAAPERHTFVPGDICDRSLVDRLLRQYAIDTIVHFAAESHVDRSITGPAEFVRTNVIGTFTLLEAARSYWQIEQGLTSEQIMVSRRFHHISTDEVYGSLSPDAAPFTETHPYEPNSPYSASKAGSDHLVRAYFHTYGLPATTTNCSNNYGPYHYPEKLIPLILLNALNGKPLPIYGDGKNVRDWLYVVDHARAIMQVLREGSVGETYNVGGNNEKTNQEVVDELCRLLDELKPRTDGRSYREQIAYIRDRPGHDRRYAIDATKIFSDLAWQPLESFETGLRKTVEWYLSNHSWITAVMGERYGDWIAQQYKTPATTASV